MNRPDRGIARRRFVGAVAAAAVAPAAGCVGGGDEDGHDDHDDHDHDTDDAGDGDEPHPDLVVDGRSLSDAFPLELVEPDAEVEGHATGRDLVAHVQWHEDELFNHWHHSPLSVPAGGSRRVRVRFVDSDLESIPLGDDGPFGVDVSLVDASPEGFLSMAVDGDLLELTGEEPGEGELVFDLLHEGESAWTSPPLEVVVVEESADE